MPYYRQVGDIPRKRHSYVPAEGGLRFEELMGHDGFAQESSLLYHRGSPSAIVAAEVVHGVSGLAIVIGTRRRSRRRVVRRDDRQRALPRCDRRPTRLRAVGPRCARVELRRDCSRAR